MLRTRAALILLGLIATFLTPVDASAIVSSNPTPDCSAGSTCTITFTSTGDYYQWSAPHSGNYTLEVWGAQGGNGTPFSSSFSSTGGLGGYAKGIYAASANEVLNIYVGGRGGSAPSSVNSSTSVQGGWNGGGSATLYGMAGGGGATDIRVGGTGLANRIIVAGGGGGGGNAESSVVSSNGGPGGGSSAPTMSNSTQFGGRTPGAGGTQSSGNALGVGQNSSTDNLRGAGGGGYYGGTVGGNSTGGGGGSGYVGVLTSTTLTAGNASMPNPDGGTMTGRSGSGIAKITYENSPSVNNFSTTQSSPTNISTSGTISYSLVLSQSVSDLATGDFQLGGTSTCNTPGLSGSGTTYTVTLTNCSEGTVILQLKANSVTGTSAGPTSLSSANTVVIDRTAPTISAVHSIPTGTYYPGSSITFNLAVSETVTVSGLPRIPLTVGSVTRYATYSSGSNSKILSFVYTIASDKAEVDTDNVVMNSPVELNSGSITDLASNAMSALTYTVSPLTLIIAQTPSAPTITSITPSSGTLSVVFTAGAANGSAITNYEYSTNNGLNWKARASDTTASPLVITTVSQSTSSLSNGTSYNVRIRAVNAAGSGDSSTAVAATPSAVVITGDATLTTTYGSLAATGTYTSSGGTGPYTYTLSATPSGVSISGGVVTASSSTPAGTYTQNVVSTDSAVTPQTGLKQLVITVNKASTTITISLPNAATDAALGGAITITATVSQAGAVNFRLGGSSISGCSSVTSSAGTATCSWTPGSLGSASLTAVLTPTDSNNYEAATTSTLSITVVNGVTTLSLSLAGGVTQVQKSRAIVITATVDQVGRITFFADGRKIPKCSNLSVSGSTKNCTWKPSIQKQVTLTSRLVPTNSAYSNATASLNVWVVRRTGTR